MTGDLAQEEDGCDWTPPTSVPSELLALLLTRPS
jgi:hypothetical protein